MADETFTFGVYIISYRRYKRGVITGKNFENPHHVVRKSEEQAYIEHGFQNVVAVDDALVSSYSDVYNWVVENTPEDVVAIVDDDVKAFSYRLRENERIDDPQIVQAEFERLAQLLHDLGLGVAFGTATSVPYGYTSEFKWSGTPGAFKIVNKAKVKSRMDPSIPRSSDIDYVLKELMTNRVCLNALYLCDVAYKDKDTSTSGSLYAGAEVAANVQIMKAKWGKYFEYDEKKNVPKIMVER